MKIEKKQELGRKLQELTLKTAGIAENTTAGNLVTPMLSDLLTQNYLTGTIFERCKKFIVSPDHNSIKAPIAKQVNRTVAAGIAGGVKSFIIDEEGSFTASVPAFSYDILKLNKQGILIRVTDEILNDAPVLATYLSQQIEATMKYYIDHFIIYGNGDSIDYNITGDQVGPTCNGIVNSGSRATKFVSLSSSFTLAELQNMVKSYYGGENGVWVMARDSWADIVALVNAANSYNAIKWHENEEDKLVPYLFGYEVILKDCMNSKDIGLCDFSAYTIAMIDPKLDISGDIYFSRAEQAFRLVYRINGMPNWIGGIKEQSGQVNYPFVFKSTADQNSSSSSSSSIEKFSSSSVGLSSSSSSVL